MIRIFFYFQIVEKFYHTWGKASLATQTSKWTPISISMQCNSLSVSELKLLTSFHRPSAEVHSVYPVLCIQNIWKFATNNCFSFPGQYYLNLKNPHTPTSSLQWSMHITFWWLLIQSLCYFLCLVRYIIANNNNYELLQNVFECTSSCCCYYTLVSGQNKD